MTNDLALAHSPLTMLSDDEVMFRDAVAGFANEEVRPRVQQMERDAKIDPSLIKKFFDMGLMGIEVADEYGGAGGSLFMVALGVEEISKIDPAAAILMDVQNTLVNFPIRTYGSDYIKSTYLPQLTGEKVGAYALSEASSGSDAFGMQTRAEQKGDRWILNGRKMWITNGAEAQIYVVFANANPQAGYKGITAFVVERGFKGFSVGKKEDKMGIRASSTTELILDDVEVPAENVLGPVGQGYKVAIETLNEGRIGIGAQMIGVAAGALHAATEYVKERTQFGKKLGDFQGIQFQLAQARTELEAARLMVYNAARLKDAGRDIAMEGAMATSISLELFGGYGYTKDYPAEKFYRDAKIGAIYEGTSNMQLQTIAKGMLK
jgi:alkylation response protein AidB-like acyl-CoA dehydrogenase